MGYRKTLGIEGLWGQFYVDWDLTSGNAFEAFMLKRQEMLPITLAHQRILGGHIGPRDPILGHDPHGPLWIPSPHLGIPGQALQRVPSPPELGGVHRHLERMLA